MTDHDIDKLYKQQAKEQPSIAVDNKITQLAQQSITPTKTIKSNNSSRKYMPFSLIASVMLVGILLLNFPQHYTHSPAEIPTDAPTKQSLPLEINEKVDTSVDFSQELLNFQPPSSVINKRQKLAKKEQLQRQKTPYDKQVMHTLLKKIAQKTAVNNTIEAAKLAQQYVDQFGLDQLPKKYHYLLIKRLK